MPAALARILSSMTAAMAMTAAFAMAAPVAVADTDPIPDVAEALVCGFPAIAGVVNALPSSAGRCVGGIDYVNPLFTPTACPDCSTAVTYQILDQPLLPAGNVPSVALPPVGIPAQGPYGTPGIDQPVGTVLGFRSGEQYCISIVPESGSPLGQCADLGPAGTLIPPVGPVSLVSVPAQSVGPTPGVSAGQFGATPGVHVPATSFDLTVSSRWVESRLNQRLGPGLVNFWEPVDFDDPAAVQWWVDNGNQTTLDLTLTLEADGAPLQTVTVTVPYVGQAAAALQKITQ